APGGDGGAEWNAGATFCAARGVAANGAGSAQSMSDPAPASASELWSWLRALARFRPNAAMGGVVSVRSQAGAAEVSAGEHPQAALLSRGRADVRAQCALDADAAQLFERYAPLCAVSPESFVVAHLGQSLDGRIGPPSGMPEAITG